MARVGSAQGVEGNSWTADYGTVEAARGRGIGYIGYRASPWHIVIVILSFDRHRITEAIASRKMIINAHHLCIVIGNHG